MKDSTIQVIENIQIKYDDISCSIDTLRYKFDSLTKVNIHLNSDAELLRRQLGDLSNSLDSLKLVSRDMVINQSYFDDIISAQLMWFSIIAAVIIGGLAAFSWKLFFIPMKREIEEYKRKDRASRISLLKKIKQNHTSVNDYITSTSSELIEQLVQTETLLKKDVSESGKNANEMIRETKKDFEELIKTQKEEFNNVTQELTDNINNTDFDAKRAVYFNFKNNETSNVAIQWLVGLLAILSKQENLNESSFDAFMGDLPYCIDRLEYEKWREPTFIDFYEMIIAELSKVIDLIKDEERRSKLIEYNTAFKERIYKLNLDSKYAELQSENVVEGNK